MNDLKVMRVARGANAIAKEASTPSIFILLSL